MTGSPDALAIARDVSATLDRWRLERDKLPAGGPLRRRWNEALDRVDVLASWLYTAARGGEIHGPEGKQRRMALHAVLGSHCGGYDEAGKLQRRGLGELRGTNPDWIWNRDNLERMSTGDLETLFEELTASKPDLPEPDDR